MQNLIQSIEKAIQEDKFFVSASEVSAVAFQQLGRMSGLIKMIDNNQIDFEGTKELLKDQYKKFHKELGAGS